jgi:hypothetical protein
MRFLSIGLGIAIVLAASAASAAGGVGGKGDTGGKGGNGPGVPDTGGPSGGDKGSSAGVDTSQAQFGGASAEHAATGEKPAEKPWEVTGVFETHRLIRQEDLNGSGAVKTFNVLFAVGRYDITDRDRVQVSAGGYQYFLADTGESGFRADDISLAYTRLVPLPAEFKLRVTPGATIPISFDSQLASNITSPSLQLRLTRTFGDFTVDARVTGRAYIDRYTTAAEIGANGSTASGQTNPKWRLGGTISGEYSMPFHHPLSAGVALIDSYIWYYDVGQCQAVQDPQFGNQPMQQSYGGEVFVRYQMPNVGGMKSDITLALANGDPSLGYPSVMHDTGVVHPYFFYRDTAEFYAALSASY